MNVLLSPQPPVFPHQHENPRLSPQRSLSPFHNMAASRKRKADEDGDETMSPQSSPAISARSLARPAKKIRSNELIGRPLSLPRLLETLDTSQLRTVLERICERHPDIGNEVVSGAPRPTVTSALALLQDYLEKLKDAAPYGESSPEYTYYRVKDALVALIDALFDFTPQFLPPNETQPTKSLQFLDGATDLIHKLPDWEPHAYRHHKENAYEEISKAWALVINEAGKRGGGINLHSGGWDQTLNQHNHQSGGRMASAISAMGNSVGWMGPNGNGSSSNTSDPNSILNQLMSGTYGAPVRVGPL
ncbi:Tethering factor for nuclear proteasome sts1 [Neonectria punicea]|uniref:Tethering factor for nuclear proteasome STS1 n=1 Tax=Neonectria punicea TaxID=979145 RepID=A0ABR1H2Q2_9HYPO